MRYKARWSYKQADGSLFGTAVIHVIAALNKSLIIKNTKEGSERSIANWKHMGKPKTIPDRNREKSVI